VTCRVSGCVVEQDGQARTIALQSGSPAARALVTVISGTPESLEFQLGNDSSASSGEIGLPGAQVTLGIDASEQPTLSVSGEFPGGGSLSVEATMQGTRISVTPNGQTTSTRITVAPGSVVSINDQGQLKTTLEGQLTDASGQPVRVRAWVLTGSDGTATTGFESYDADLGVWVLRSTTLDRASQLPAGHQVSLRLGEDGVPGIVVDTPVLQDLYF